MDPVLQGPPPKAQPVEQCRGKYLIHWCLNDLIGHKLQIEQNKNLYLSNLKYIIDNALTNIHLEVIVENGFFN